MDALVVLDGSEHVVRVAVVIDGDEEITAIWEELDVVLVGRELVDLEQGGLFRRIN